MKSLSLLISWIFNIIVWGLIAVIIIFLANVIIGLGIDNYWFGSWTSGISQIWPEIMYPLGLLIGLLLIVDHRPNQY